MVDSFLLSAGGALGIWLDLTGRMEKSRRDCWEAPLPTAILAGSQLYRGRSSESNPNDLFIPGAETARRGRLPRVLSQREVCGIPRVVCEEGRGGEGARGFCFSSSSPLLPFHDSEKK